MLLGLGRWDLLSGWDLWGLRGGERGGLLLLLLLLLLCQLEVRGRMQELRLPVLELLLVVDGDLLLDHHLFLLEVDLLLLLDQRVRLDLCVCG